MRDAVDVRGPYTISYNLLRPEWEEKSKGKTNELARMDEDALRQRRFARVDVGKDAEVPDLGDVHILTLEECFGRVEWDERGGQQASEGGGEGEARGRDSVAGSAERGDDHGAGCPSRTREEQ
jgi:hypothetical protein